MAFCCVIATVTDAKCKVAIKYDGGTDTCVAFPAEEPFQGFCETLLEAVTMTNNVHHPCQGEKVGTRIRAVGRRSGGTMNKLATVWWGSGREMSTQTWVNSGASLKLGSNQGWEPEDTRRLQDPQ